MHVGCNAAPSEMECIFVPPLRASSTHTYLLRLCTMITVRLKMHLEMGTRHSPTESSTTNRKHNYAKSKRRVSTTHLKRHNQLMLQIGTSHSVGTLSTLAPISHLAFVVIMISRSKLWRPPSQWERSAISGIVLTWKSGANTYFFV